MALPASVTESRQQGIQLHQYVYNKLTEWAYVRAPRGPKILSNGVPLAAFSQCDAQVNHKRDTNDACIAASMSVSDGVSTNGKSRISTASSFQTSISANRGPMDISVPSSQPATHATLASSDIPGSAYTGVGALGACTVTAYVDLQDPDDLTKQLGQFQQLHVLYLRRDDGRPFHYCYRRYHKLMVRNSWRNNTISYHGPGRLNTRPTGCWCPPP